MHYIFGDFSLDTARYELRRAGQVVPLRGKVFAVLAYLVRHANHVASREELLEQVWRRTSHPSGSRHLDVSPAGQTSAPGILDSPENRQVPAASNP